GVMRGGVLLNHYEAGETKGIPGVLLEVLETLLYAPVRVLQIVLMPKDLRPHIGPNIFQRLKAVLSLRNIRGYLAAEHAYVGGFGYVYEAGDVWSTAYKYRPSALDEEPTRIFGIGYFETSMVRNQLAVTRRTYAPPGDDPVLLSDIRIENRSSEPKDISYYEYWDVNVFQLLVQLSVSFSVVSCRIMLLRQFLTRLWNVRIWLFWNAPGYFCCNS
ncbi:MAG: hypothetical protein HC842_08900, partial [Cytophagales bacterium]|nr:hypothetical protein [Cytophagales bacterium]